MTNRQVSEQFLQGKSGKSLNMTSTGSKLFSYNTVIVQWVEGKLVFNSTKYSRTTSKQTNWIKQHCHMVTSEFVPINTYDLEPYASIERVK